MTLDQKIFSMIEEQGKLLRKLSRQMNGNGHDEWLTEKQVKEKHDISKKFLQRKRKDGTLKLGKDFRCLKSGRKFEYKQSSIEKLFTEIKN